MSKLVYLADYYYYHRCQLRGCFEAQAHIANIMWVLREISLRSAIFSIKKSWVLCADAVISWTALTQLSPEALFSPKCKTSGSRAPLGAGAYMLPQIPWKWPGRGGNKPEGERGKVRKEGREGRNGRKRRNLEGRKLSRSFQVLMPMITIVALPEEDCEDAPRWTVKLRQRSQEFKMTYLV